jgi:hypothetical protein
MGRYYKMLEQPTGRTGTAIKVTVGRGP